MTELIFGLANANYHAHPALSKSGLDRLDRSPAHYQAWLTESRKATPALKLGTAAHCAILEPERMLAEYVVADASIDRRTKLGKEAWADLEASGRIILSADEAETVQAMRSAVLAHPAARELLSEGHPEVSAFGQLGGVAVKCRPDWLRQDGIVVDLKTTEDASPGAFPGSVARYRYHTQAAFYQDLLAALDITVRAFVFVGVEKAPPYAVGVYELDADSLEAGRAAYQRNLDTYRRCQDTGVWPAYSSAIETITLPRWAFQQAA